MFYICIENLIICSDINGNNVKQELTRNMKQEVRSHDFAIG